MNNKGKAIVSLHKHMDELFDAQRRLSEQHITNSDIRFEANTKLTDQMKESENQRFAAVDQATRLATAALEYRLEGLNNTYNLLRSTMSATVTRGEFDVMAAQMIEVRTAVARMEGRLLAFGLTSGVLTVVASIGAVVVAHIIR